MFKYLLIISAPLFSQMMPPVDFSEAGSNQIAVQNSILAKVNGTTISMMDVKKRMDMTFHQNYAQLRHSPQARCQFYSKSWRPILMEIIDNELILADAADREIKINDAEVREAIENRFGPNVLSTLDKIGLTLDEASKMMKNELIVQRMSWWFVQSKAFQSVTPQEIRQAYRTFLEENPSYQKLKYRIVTIRGENLQINADKIHQILTASGKSPESLTEQLLEINPSIQVSSEYTVTDLEISEAHKSALSSLESGAYSVPMFQKNRADNKEVFRIFYLSSKTDHPAPNFQEISASLRDQLVQQSMQKHSQNYVQKLRKHYGFDPELLKEALPEDMHPFSLQ